jgi:hypothetical protein
MSVVAISTGDRGSGSTGLTTDTWEEFEDMQGVMPDQAGASQGAKVGLLLPHGRCGVLCLMHGVTPNAHHHQGL